MWASQVGIRYLVARTGLLIIDANRAHFLSNELNSNRAIRVPFTSLRCSRYPLWHRVPRTFQPGHILFGPTLSIAPPDPQWTRTSNCRGGVSKVACYIVSKSEFRIGEVMAEYAKFRYYLEKHYVLPMDIKNDIIYCQRAMRDFLKVHGVSNWVNGGAG